MECGRASPHGVRSSKPFSNDREPSGVPLYVAILTCSSVMAGVGKPRIASSGAVAGRRCMNLLIRVENLMYQSFRDNAQGSARLPAP